MTSKRTPVKDSFASRFRRASIQSICTATLTWLVLGIFRSIILGQPATLSGALDAIPLGLAASFYDLVFVAGVTVATVVLLYLTRASRVASMLVVTLFYLSILISIAWGFANIQLVKVLGEPFTFQWLVYGDFLRNADARNAMSDAFSLSDLAALAVSILVVLLLGLGLGRLWLQLGRTAHHAVLAVTVFVIGVVAAGSGYHIQASAYPTAKVQNPVVHFLKSALLTPTPVVLTMKANTSDPSVASVAERPPERSTFKAPVPNPIKNVLIFIMESVPAKYVETYGGSYPVTPNLGSLAGSAIRFDRIYAHAPSTNYTLFSLFSSMYNDISYYGMTSSNPYLKLDSLTNMLAGAGWRTGFFWSADSRFQRVDEFLANKGIGTNVDFRGIKCTDPAFKISTDSFRNADYVSDLCTARSLTDWIDDGSDKPFAAIMFTAMTHYPYQVTDPADPQTIAASAGGGPLVHYAGDEKFNSYLNALRIGDRALGEVIDGLKRSGKLDSTLVVVMGDHGEAFGEHGTYSHASALYEENVHIPLMLINSHLFHGETDGTIGGIVDIAPTIFDILGLPLPAQWQGRSLFSEQRPGVAFFFAPWRGVQFGYRKGDEKLIFNATTGNIEVYDLARDPAEARNLFDPATADQVALLQPVADWVQSQRQRIATLVAASSTVRPDCTVTSIDIEAAGTDSDGPPRFEVLLDGRVISAFDVPGPKSSASTSKEALAEMRALASDARPFHVPVDGGTSPQAIQIRFVNDHWGSADHPGDRNLLVKDVRVNGVAVPRDRLHADEESHGYTDDSGTAMYANGSLWVRGPFAAGCN